MDLYRRNLVLFIAFRVLFNARFYYPVLGVLFVDLGLSLAEYGVLNAVWAAAIILLEVPSGALADSVGRRVMVVWAAGLFVCEMVLFALAPVGGGGWLFWVLVANRILSGAAEAGASGADEALAYDSLGAGDREAEWRKVLARLVQWQSGAFFTAMLVGAVVFDRGLLGSVCGAVGLGFPEWSTTKWPVYITLVLSVVCLGVALLMREPPGGARVAESWRAGVAGAVANVRRGAAAILSSRRMFALLLVLLVCDSFIRLFLTFSSNFIRAIEMPAWVNGPAGASVALLGFLAAPLARWACGHRTARANFLAVGGVILVGLVGVALAVPGWGILAVLPLGLSMSVLGFFGSYYLNRWASDSVRATVLSFRGVALNLGYGTIGLAFSGLTAWLARGGGETDSVFVAAIFWLPTGFLACAVVVGGLIRLHRAALSGIPRADGGG